MFFSLLCNNIRIWTSQIVPALYLEKKLFAIGEFDVDKLKSITS